MDFPESAAKLPVAGSTMSAGAVGHLNPSSQQLRVLCHEGSMAAAYWAGNSTIGGLGLVLWSASAGNGRDTGWPLSPILLEYVGLAMPSAVAPGVVASRTVTCRVVIVRRFSDRNQGSVPQIRGEHQDQRRDNPKRQERVKRWEHGPQISARIAGQPPGDRSGCKPANRTRSSECRAQLRGASRTWDTRRQTKTQSRWARKFRSCNADKCEPPRFTSR